jgi:hypothetical protein
VATIVARIRAVAEAGGPMAALAMANDQLLPWRHWLTYQPPAEEAIPESFPSRWTRKEALACLDAIATAVASSASASASTASAVENAEL